VGGEAVRSVSLTFYGFSVSVMTSPLMKTASHKTKKKMGAHINKTVAVKRSRGREFYSPAPQQ